MHTKLSHILECREKLSVLLSVAIALVEYDIMEIETKLPGWLGLAHKYLLYEVVMVFDELITFGILKHLFYCAEFISYQRLMIELWP